MKNYQSPFVEIHFYSDVSNYLREKKWSKNEKKMLNEL